MKIYTIGKDKKTPELGKKVLVFINGNDEPIIAFLSVEETKVTEKGIEKIFTFKNQDNEFSGATHWCKMPLLSDLKEKTTIK